MKKRDKDFPEFDYIESIPKDKQLVIAGRSKSSPRGAPLGLVFMVGNCKDPDIPGYPAYCVGGNGDTKRCQKFIDATYKRLGRKNELSK